MHNLAEIGTDWLVDNIRNFTDEIIHIDPVTFNEENRYLPGSVTSMPGYMNFDINPYMKEILMCFDPESPVREVNLKKGVQVTYTTILECCMYYLMDYVKTEPCMYITADKDLAQERVENNILPMLNASGRDILRSSDEGNTRKTGKTKNHLQWIGGGYMIPIGSHNGAKMRQFSVPNLFKDEIDAWPEIVSKDGDPDGLTDDRCSGYWKRRKILRGSTPLLRHNSLIDKAFRRGDQREYRVLCRACSFPQKLRWNGVNEETGHEYGFTWEMDNGILVMESVRYRCKDCGHEHFEHDKPKLFALEHGAHWHPTATPVEPGIRSYHLPGFYSPVGFAPWSKCVSDYLAGFDPVQKKVIDIGKFQKFYNNILGESFEVLGSKVTFQAVSGHRRIEYKYGEIPNEYAIKHSGGPILFLTCQVDVHKRFLAVSIMGWTKDAKCYLIDYWYFKDDSHEDGCGRIESPVWARVQDVIDNLEYISDDGRKYNLKITLIDANWKNDVVTSFCSRYESGVYPILGRERSAKNQRIEEFAEFKTKIGTFGYRILVDHYKDRLAPVLRREWVSDAGEQSRYHFNAPIDTTDKQLKELTVETRKEKRDERNNISYVWDRPGNARNELWDLLVYGHAAVEIFAWAICVKHFELDTIDWDRFWEFVQQNILAPVSE